MAALVAGVQYGLSSQGSFNENKSLIFVKLTDSAYRAIEEYIKNKNKCTQTPTIQFLGNEGHLSLPSSQSARGEAGFNFSLSSNEDIEGTQGSFECIQQTSSRCLESIGALHCKMRVQANEDVYDVTRQRMAAAEQMQKKNCTREIELDKTGFGRRVKVRTKMVSGGGGRPAISLNGCHQNSSPSPVLSGYMNHNRTAASHHTTAPQKSIISDIQKRPIRDRLIHMLAVRPYKKPELYNILIKEGIRDKDRTQLMSTLCKIATQRDNTYHLSRHVWNDVREDWPYYTEQDRQMLKRRKPQNLTPPGSSDGGSSVGSGQSPSSVHPGSPPSVIEPPPTSKRPGYYDGADGLPTKRQRISHYKPAVRPDPMPSKPTIHPIHPKDSGGDSGGGGGISFSSNSSIVGCNATNGFNNRYSGSGVRWSPSSTSGTTTTSSMSSSANPLVDNSSSPVIDVKERKQHSSSVSAMSSLPTSLSSSIPSSSTLSLSSSALARQTSLSSNGNVNSTEPKYISDYPRIETMEQRRRYKDDFNTNYVEYRKLYTIVDKVSRRFAQLEARLKREAKHSEQWKAIMNQIVGEYEVLKKDVAHHEAKKRFHYLHEKLSYIKRQVMEFDLGHANTSS